MNVLCSYSKAETIVKKSRFIAEVFPIQSQTDAREILKKQKTTYADAAHVVHAFICGSQAQISGMSDDGEPSGTAGRPVLDVLKGQSITNVLLTVTRYFGGTLLGTGGLVKSYGDAAKSVLSAAEVEPLIERKKFSYVADYDMYEGIKRQLTGLSLTSVTESFSSKITIEGFIEARDADLLVSRVKDLSHGKIQVQIS